MISDLHFARFRCPAKGGGGGCSPLAPYSWSSVKKVAVRLFFRQLHARYTNITLFLKL